MNYEVTGCKDCPFYVEDIQDLWIDRSCKNPYHETKVFQEIDRGKSGEPITPDWCPLNQSPITIIKK